MTPVYGAQEPRFLVRPDGAVSSAASEVIDLASQAGLVLDPWQRLCVDVILSERRDGRAAATQVGLVVPRQNGKGAILEALELGWLFLFDTPLISHSAHLFKTAQEAYVRLRGHIERNDWLRRRVKAMPNSPGNESIRMVDGRRLLFVARTGGSGRGFSADRQVLDEAYNLPDMELAAMMPTLSARPDTQLIFTSSAGMAESDTLRRIRKRGMDGDGQRFAYLEWSVPEASNLDDPATWAASNPGMGYRISVEAIEDERRTLSDADFARERCGIWESSAASAAIPWEVFESRVSESAEPEAPLVLAVDASPGGASASLGVIGGGVFELIDHRDGMGWLVDAVTSIHQRWGFRDVVLDPAGPIGAMVPDLDAAGVDITKMTGRDVAAACGGLVQALHDGGVTVRADESLSAAVQSARWRTLGDAQAFRRADADISPLMVLAFALWGQRSKARPEVDLLSQIF